MQDAYMTPSASRDNKGTDFNKYVHIEQVMLYCVGRATRLDPCRRSTVVNTSDRVVGDALAGKRYVPNGVVISSHPTLHQDKFDFGVYFASSTFRV